MDLVKFTLATVISLLSIGCRNHKEFIQLKKELFHKESVSLPIYADPPTGDYMEVKEGKFSFQIDSSKLAKIRKYQYKLEPTIVQYIDSSYAWVYLAAYLKLESAIPKLKQALLKCDKFYGWEGGNYNNINHYLEDGQYCFQLAYISATEYITGKKIDKAINLSETEYDALKVKSLKCNMDNMDSLDVFCPAKWLLDKLKLEEK